MNLSRLWNSPTITTWLVFSNRVLRFLVLMPLAVSFMPPEKVAVFYLYFGVLALGRAVHMAFTATYVRAFAYAWKGADSLVATEVFPREDGSKTETNWEFFRRIYGTSGAVQGALTLLLALVLGVVGMVALGKPIDALENPQEGWWAWSAILVTVVFQTLGVRDGSSLQGLGQVALVNRWWFFLSFGASLASCLLLVLGWGLYSLAIPQLVSAVLRFLSLKVLLRKTDACPHLPGAWRQWDRTVLTEMWGPTWRQLLIVVLGYGVVQSSGLVLANFVVGAELASYLLALRMMTQVAEFSRAPFYAKLPFFAGLRAAGDTQGLARKTGRSMQRTFIAFSLGAIAVPLAVPVLFELVDSRTPFVDSGLWLLMALVWLVERHHGMHVQVVMTQNKVPFVLVTLVTGLLHLGLMAALIGPFGPWGLVLAHGLSNLAIYSWFPAILSWRSLGTHWRDNFRAYWREAVGAIVLIALVVPFSGPIGEWALGILRSIIPALGAP